MGQYILQEKGRPIGERIIKHKISEKTPQDLIHFYSSVGFFIY